MSLLRQSATPREVAVATRARTAPLGRTVYSLAVLPTDVAYRHDDYVRGKRHAVRPDGRRSLQRNLTITATVDRSRVAKPPEREGVVSSP